jgi:uncharacterized sodium:solute symporter family permease YidK
VSKLLSYGVSAIGLQIAVYYGLAGAVAVAYRKVLLRSVRNFLFIGLWPLAGGIFMLTAFAQSIHSLGGTTDAVGLGAIGLGIIPLGYYWLTGSPALRRAPRSSQDVSGADCTAITRTATAVTAEPASETELPPA